MSIQMLVSILLINGGGAVWLVINQIRGECIPQLGSVLITINRLIEGCKAKADHIMAN